VTKGGFAPDLGSNRAALDLIVEAISKAGYKPGEQVFIALDVAATEFFDSNTKKYSIDGKQLDSAAMVEFLADWVANYPICSIEDGCSEDDWAGWKLLTDKRGRPQSNWWATTCSSPIPSDCNAASTRVSRTAS
jgi:enolase